MKSKLLSLTFILFLFFTASSQEIKAPVFGKGILNFVGKDSTWSIKFAARMQFLASADWEKGPEGGLINPSSNMLIRRARLKFDGFAVSPKLIYKIELGLSNRDMAGQSEFTRNAPRTILDAVIKWNFYGNFVLWAGQTKLPGNIERVISSGNLQLVDRSLLNAAYNIDRDIGLQLRHHFNLSDKFLVREKFAFSQGEGRNVVTGNLGGHQYTGRLELLPFGKFKNKGDYSGSDLEREIKPKLMLSATYDINSNAVRTRSNLGNFMYNDVGLYETTINTLFVDAMFKYRGFSFMGEYANRTADDPIAKNSDGTETGDSVNVGNGLNLATGYVFKSNWALAFRFSDINPDLEITGNNKSDQYTFGISKFVVGHKLKVQTDVSFLDVLGETDILLYRLQVDLHF
ncbi:MAG: OprO/OprP family phosphate-selective porin [Eudoraea sp.]|nr:OprO/OprP family phosphate-selective porin [Eudoraea sp.]MBT8293401.1 OprO/OprP family phosphate-selective porin [Eudoraea sp.]NNL02185.1 porin [Eudoraea sp.]